MGSHDENTQSKLYMLTYLIGKSNKAKATAPLCMTIHHNNGINYFAKFFKEAEELFIIDCN